MIYSRDLAIYIGLFHCFRLLTGAISVLFFLKKGITVPDLALLQIFFSTTSLFLNYPTGILADNYSPKPFVLLSCFFMAIYYMICGYSQNLYSLIIAHCLQAFGLSLIMGASSAWIAGWHTKESHNNKNYLNYLGHLTNEIEAIGGIIAGLIGAALSFFLTDNSYAYVFFLTAILMFLTLFVLALIPSPPKDASPKHAFFIQKKEMLRASPPQKGTILFFLSIGLVTALNQPLFHFWQPFFRNFHTHFSKYETIMFGIYFSTFSISRYVANRILKNEALNNGNVNFFVVAIVLAFFTFLSCFLLSTKLESLLISIILFCILHGCLSVISKIIHDQYIKQEGNRYIARTLSLGEVFGRLFSLCILWLLYLWIDRIGIRGIFFIASFLALVLTFNLRAWEKHFIVRAHHL